MSETSVQTSDPTEEYDWLDEVQSDTALAWVREHTERTERELHDAQFHTTVDRIREVLDSPDRIPMVTKRGEHYYNFWKDAAHRLGQWRRTTWESYRTDNPDWEILLDLDELAVKEGQDWHFAGAQLLRPAPGEPYRQALVRLSPDGGDQVAVREFDLENQIFVPEGFQLPVAKTSASWLDADTLLVASATNPLDTTRSTYARTVRSLTRGAELRDAPVVFEVDAEHVLAGVQVDSTPGFERTIFTDVLDFYNSRTYLQIAGKNIAVDVPTDVNVFLHRQWFLFAPRTDWQHAGNTYPAGSLIMTTVDKFLETGTIDRVVFTPQSNSSLQGMDFTANYLLLTLLTDVRSEVHVLDLHSNSEPQRLTLDDPLSSVSVSAVDDEDESCADEIWMTSTGFTTPTILSRGPVGDQLTPVKSSPARFSADDLEVSQHFAISADGTRIPYFQVSPRDLVLDGQNPVLMDGYGGFQHSMTPGYSPALGRGWLERSTADGRGASYVLANIRGGGEYGPRWHQAALQANRHRAYEDFAAIAEDLVRRQVTSREHLAATGRSNGGLLMGNMITGYPQLFGAISCGVPLLDMRRYTRLAAGHSWIAEYGDPEIPEQWKYVRTFSPLHRIFDEPQHPDSYPASLIWTTTTDDRVGPSQARKLAAAMMDRGITNVRYHEPQDGGHAGSTDNESTARMLATSYEFLWRQIR
ncbi:prolyl oligopeptidase family serine peptidase [Glutamicibacter endophyticus]